MVPPMSQRQQLRLIFSNSNLQTSSPRQKMLRYDSLKRSSSKASTSPFLTTMRRLERVSPVHAHVLERLARQMIARATADIQTEG